MGWLRVIMPKFMKASNIFLQNLSLSVKSFRANLMAYAS